MKRLGAFLLGMLFGMIFLVGLIALGAYIAVAVIKPADVVNDADVYLGDMANMSLLDIAKSLSETYQTNLGIKDSETGKYYSFGQFFQQYGIDPSVAFGIEFPQEVLDLPMFEFFNPNDGVSQALDQVKVSAVLCIANMFSSGELTNEQAMEELANYSVKDLFSEGGIATVFQNISLSDILSSAFPSEDSDNKLIWALGQAKIGKLLAGFSGEDSIFLQLKVGGALEEMGKLEAGDLLGNTGALGNLLSGLTIASLIDDSGSLSITGLFESAYLGTMLGYTREVVQPGNTTIAQDGNVIVKEGAAVAKSEDGETFYRAELVCEESHTHAVSCYDYIWFNTAVASDSHIHDDANEMIDSDGHHLRVGGLYKAFVGLKLSDLLDGGASGLLDSVKDLTLSDIVGGEISGVMANFANMTVNELLNGGIEGIYVGAFLNYTRQSATAPSTYTTLRDAADNVTGYVSNGAPTVMSDNATDWYEATPDCTETHTHTRNCYHYVWYQSASTQATGLMLKLADKTVGKLNDMDSMIKTLTLADVLGRESLGNGILAELADATIENLPDQVNYIYLGSALNFFRKTATAPATFDTVGSGTNTCFVAATSPNHYVRSNDGTTWYEAVLDCKQVHTHTPDCYAFCWYRDESCTTPVDGIENAFVNAQIGNIQNTINHLTLGKLGIGGNNILDALKDEPIDNLGNSLNTLEMGVVFGFEKVGSVWYEKCNGCTHTSSQHQTLSGLDGYYTPAKGINGKIASKTISEIASGNGLTDIVVQLTVGDLIDSGMMTLSSENIYLLNIIFCKGDNCDFAGYGIYKITHPSAQPSEYYHTCTHPTATDANCEQGANWRNKLLEEFIGTLLSAIS